MIKGKGKGGGEGKKEDRRGKGSTYLRINVELINFASLLPLLPPQSNHTSGEARENVSSMGRIYEPRNKINKNKSPINKALHKFYFGMNKSFIPPSGDSQPYAVLIYPFLFSQIQRPNRTISVRIDNRA